MEKHFANYMFCSIVPVWVRHVSREIEQQVAIGTLDAQHYGICTSSPSPQLLSRGRALDCLLLMLASYLHEDLLLVIKNCYFLPCY